MIACRAEGVRHGAENTVPSVLYVGGLAVHHLFGMDDLAAEALADALVTEAYAEDRDLTGEALNERNRNARFVGRARSGRDDDEPAAQGGALGKADFIVAMNRDFLPQLAEILDEVVGERVVIVDHQ